MTDRVLLDTSVFVRLTEHDEIAAQYRELLGKARVSLSFQVEAELLEFSLSERWGERRKRALESLRSLSTRVPHTLSTSYAYAAVVRANRQLRVICGGADCWIVAQALEHRVPLMTHDRNQARLARAVGVDVLTLLAAD